MAMEAFDLAERFQTPVFVMMDLDLGMNNWMSDGFEYPTSPIDRGKRADAGDPEEAGRVGPLQGRGRRRHPVPHDSGRRHAGVLHARFRPQREGAVQRAAGRLREQRRPAEPQVRDGADATCRRRSSRRRRTPKIGIIGYGTSHWAIIESRDQLREETKVKTSYLRRARVSVHRGSGDVHRRARAHLRRRAEPRRASCDADEAGAVAGARARSCAACCTTTGCRSTRAASATTSWRRKASKCAKSSTAWHAIGGVRHASFGSMTGWRVDDNGDPNQGQSHRARAAGLQGRQDDAVRRMRAQRHFRAHHRRVLRDGRRSQAGHQAVGHRLLEQEPGVFPRRLARLQRRARPDAVGRHRRDAGQPEAHRHRRQRRRRHRRHRHRPVRAPDAPQPAASSTSSKTTAATA